MQILIKCLKSDDFLKMLDLNRNVPEIFGRKSRDISPDSTSLPNVKLVDGLPSARHTEAVGGPMGCLGQRLSVIWNKKCMRLRNFFTESCIEVSVKLKFVYERRL